MFGRKPKTLIQVTKLSSFVATNVEVRGDIIFSGGLRVDGRVDGNVFSKDEANGLLVLSEKGHVNGNVRVHDAVINGTIDGDLAVGHFLELQPGARVTGSIRYCQLKMECGATVIGKLEHIDEAAGGGAVRPVPAAPSANVLEITQATRVAAWPQS